MRNTIESDTAVCSAEYGVKWEIYSVSDAPDSKSYEYIVWLLGTHGNIIDSWDSGIECYNGQGHLTQDRARYNIEEIISDVCDGDETDWFDV